MTTALPVAAAACSGYLELTKPRITLMVMLTALVGFVLGSPGPVGAVPLLTSVVGTGLVAAAANALNMVLERETDARMRRTRNRPLPSGRLRPAEAWAFGVGLTASGLGLLAWTAGRLAVVVAFLTWASYVFVYTPLKARTSLATLVGAVPGALPPVIGWAAASGALAPGACALFAILFLWQIPHFLAIAWIYREDYAAGGLPMLPVVDPSGRITGRQAAAHSVALLLVSLTAPAAGLGGKAYLVGASLLGLALTAAALHVAAARTTASARRLFLVSLVYLVGVSSLLLLDRGLRSPVG
jgi:protoheme IX farnesyltransferase